MSAYPQPTENLSEFNQSVFESSSLTTANNINVIDDNSATTSYLTFIQGSGSGIKTLYADTSTTPLTYIPSTGTLTTTNIVGTNYGLVSTASSGTHALLFTNTLVTGNAPIRLDFQSTGIRYQPSTGILSVNYINNYCPPMFDDFTTTIGTGSNFGGSPYDWYQQTLGGGGTANMFGGSFDASLSAVGNRRAGFIQLQTAASAGSTIMVTSQSTIYQPSALQSITFGFINCGNGSLNSGTGLANTNYQVLGLASGTSATGANANSICWRLQTVGGTGTWSLVENNVVIEVLVGSTLTGGLTGRWCRASITFTNNGANYYGTFTNLTDNVSYTTATYATTNPNFFYQTYMSCSTNDSVVKTLAVDYVNTQFNCLPIGLTNASTSSR